MGILSGLIALCLVAAEDPKPVVEELLRQSESLRVAGSEWEAFWLLDQPSEPKTSAAEETTYQVTVLDMHSVAWRVPLAHRLKMVGQQGPAMVWTTDAATARAIKKRTGSVTAAPRVTADLGAPAVITLGPGAREFVAGVTRQANGPLHHASNIVFMPETGKVNDRMSLQVSSERIEGVNGLMARLNCEARWVTNMHTLHMPETYVDDEGIEAGTVTSQVQVPEMAACDVQGSWRVLDGEALVVSLGAHSVVDAAALERGAPADQAVRVGERLVVIEFNPGPPVADTATVTKTNTAVRSQRVVMQFRPRPPVRLEGHLDTAKLPTPAAPSRGLPSTGPQELPPLPDEATQPAAFSPSGEPQASPQSPQVRETPPVDRHAQKTSAPGECSTDSCCASASAKSTEWTAVRSSVMRIPLGDHLAIEIRATVAPAPQSREKEESR